MITHIYIDDVVFSGMSSNMVENFLQQMQFGFEMSLASELTHFSVFKRIKLRMVYLSPRASMLEI